MSYDVIVKSGFLFRSQQVSVSNSKIEQIGFKIKSKAEKLKRLTGISFRAASSILSKKIQPRVVIHFPPANNLS